MSHRVATEIDGLSTMDSPQLVETWEPAPKEPAPRHLRRQIFLPLLRYRLQEKAHGGLKQEVRQRLRKLAKSFRSGTATGGRQFHRSSQVQTRDTAVPNLAKARLTIVVVSECGFEYDGQTYQSLSRIARSITGTRWSGPGGDNSAEGLRKEGRQCEATRQLAREITEDEDVSEDAEGLNPDDPVLRSDP